MSGHPRDLSVKLYDLACLIKAWVGSCLLGSAAVPLCYFVSPLFKYWKCVPGDAYNVETSVLNLLDFICFPLLNTQGMNLARSLHVN